MDFAKDYAGGTPIAASIYAHGRTYIAEPGADIQWRSLVLMHGENYFELYTNSKTYYVDDLTLYTVGGRMLMVWELGGGSIDGDVTVESVIIPGSPDVNGDMYEIMDDAAYVVSEPIGNVLVLDVSASTVTMRYRLEVL